MTIPTIKCLPTTQLFSAFIEPHPFMGFHVPFPFPSKEIENFQDFRVILLLDYLKFSNTASIGFPDIIVYFYAFLQT